MFDFDPAEAMDSVQSAIDAVTDIESCVKLLVGTAASSTINRLVAIYPRTDRGDESRLVSKFAMRALAIILGPDLLKKLSELHGVNPSVDGYIFEAWFFSELTHNGLSWRESEELQSKKWEQSEVTFFDPALSIGRCLRDKSQKKTQTWMAPLKWNQAGYDAVFVDVKDKIVRFVQVTRVHSHKNFHHYFFIEVLNKLAVEENLGPFDVVEMCFVVPECNWATFKLPTDTVDFTRNILSVAATPHRSSRSEPNLPFQTCEAIIKVVGVEYDPAIYQPKEGSYVV